MKNALVAAALLFTGSAFAQQWQSVEADNGAIYKIEMGKLVPMMNGGVLTRIYEDIGRGWVDEAGSKYSTFDCKGNMQIGDGPFVHLEPRSIGKRLEQMACQARPKS